MTRWAKTLSSSRPKMKTMSAESVSSDKRCKSSKSLGTPARALSAGRPAVLRPPIREPIFGDFLNTDLREILSLVTNTIEKNDQINFYEN